MNDDLLKRIENLERRVSELEKPCPAPSPIESGSRPLSLREFINSKSPKTVVDTVIVIGYYLEEHSKMSSFTCEDLSKGFINAKEKPPTNPSDMLAKNARRGFIMEAPDQKDGPKAWMLTNTGVKFVENGLNEPSSG
jgi:hypothetical protein